ncbi:MAG TPA: DUF4388 domain-containing protein [Deltaproteobacteria bacterium]|nr:DUF4388 domain-containing protein [Deltaproteobacteria bacterium]
MSVALHGNLRDFGIAEVFQLIGQQRKTGVLVVGDDEDSIFLAFDEGRVVRGGPAKNRLQRDPLGPQLVRSGYVTREQLENLQRESERSARPLTDLLLATGLIEPGTLEEVQHRLTKETVFDVMRRKSGDFRFTAERVVHDTKPENLLGAEQILMDGLRMLDEWQTFADIVPSEDAVFRRIGNLEAVRALTKGDSNARLGHAERVLQLIDGRLSVRRVIDLSRLGTFEATRALAELRQAGVIELAVTKVRAPRRMRNASRQIEWFPMVRVALGTVLPFIVLGFLAVTILPRLESTRAGSAIPERLAHQIGRRLETELVRGLVETRFFESGAYPASLEEIAPEAALASPSLTPSRLADYYYRVREGEVVLLAPAQ